VDDGVPFPVGGWNFFATASRPALKPTQPPIQWVTGAISQGVKRPGRESGHSPPSSAEVKNAWSYTYTPPCYMVWHLVKQKYNFYPCRILIYFYREIVYILQRIPEMLLEPYARTHTLTHSLAHSRTQSLTRPIQMRQLSLHINTTCSELLQRHKSSEL
jgi:hypothetical protein